MKEANQAINMVRLPVSTMVRILPAFVLVLFLFCLYRYSVYPILLSGSTFFPLKVERLADRIRKCGSPNPPPWTMDREGGAAYYSHLQVPPSKLVSFLFLFLSPSQGSYSGWKSAFPGPLLSCRDVRYLATTKLA